jgi:hypothetical protein
MVKLQPQTTMPFIIMQHEYIPPASIVQRFCTMLVAIASGQEQVIFIPPWHLSILTVQRGTIIQLVVVGIPEGAPTAGIPAGIPIPGMAIPDLSLIIPVILTSFLGPESSPLV